MAPQRALLSLLVLLVAHETWTASPVCAEENLPATWVASWRDPPPEDRPLQIVHGIPANRASVDGMRYYADRGLGGIVCNVAFQDYMRSEANWRTLIAGVEACRSLGLLVWLYDEDGYPSGAAGGLVLEQNRSFEAQGLVYDRDKAEPFVIRPVYEFTHASNNYYAARRYANLIDDRAVRCFIEKTHDAYWTRLRSHFGKTIRAAFTDEPSLIAVNIGQIPEDARRRVRVVDPLDPTVHPLPAVPWCEDLPTRYAMQYDEDIVSQRRSLFEGNTAEDRKVRRQYWSLVADLIAERYFGALQTWCRAHGIASSGHTLHEESPIHHVPLEGNALKVLMKMDIPGLDMLSSDPAVVIHSGWLTAALPSSAAVLNGQRRVMTEVSDFIQRMGEAGPASLKKMQATAAWQAAWGVTEFTLYYSPSHRSAEDYRAYGDYVGRLNAFLKPARIDRQVLLYYPIHDLWEEYVPVADPLTLQSQSPRAQRLVQSFLKLGRLLQRHQIPFVVIDHEQLARCSLDETNRLTLSGGAYKALVVPHDSRLPDGAEEIVERFRQKGGLVITDDGSAGTVVLKPLANRLARSYRVFPESDVVVVGQFVRDDRRIVIVVNVGKDPYNGLLATPHVSSWHVLDPATGAIRRQTTEGPGDIPLRLDGYQALLFVRDR